MTMVKLSPAETRLLTILVRCAPRPVSARQLSEESGVAEGAVRTHLTNIRNKIGFGGPPIGNAIGEGWYVSKSHIAGFERLMQPGVGG